MSAPKDLKQGEMAWTDYRRGIWEKVRITNRQIMRSQTRIGYKCEPDVSRHGAWLDAAWFWTESDYIREVMRNVGETENNGKNAISGAWKVETWGNEQDGSSVRQSLESRSDSR